MLRNTMVAFRNFLTLMLLTVAVVLPSAGLAQTTIDNVVAQATKSKSDVELLIALSQVIEQDKLRLQELVDDSARIEPLFRRRSEAFYFYNARYDSLKLSPAATADELLLAEHEWKRQRNALDFFLERRRSIGQQMTVLRRKLKKQHEVQEFVVKGEMANIIDVNIHDKVGDVEALLPADSARAADTTLVDEEKLTHITFNKYNWRIVEAARELEILKAKFEFAQRSWELVEQLLVLNLDDLSVARALNENNSRQLEQWKAVMESLQDRLKEIPVTDSASELREAIQLRYDETSELLARVQPALRKDSALFISLQARIDRLHSIQEPLTKAVESAAAKIEKQNRRLEYLKGPLNPNNIYAFVIKRGPRLLLVILVVVVIWALSRWVTRHILVGFSRYNSSEDREGRVDTLNRAIKSALTVIFLFIGIIALLSEFGIKVSVLLGGAAVFSLALAFGAQSLIKDYFTGFMILVENQYLVGNVVRINQIAGVVEDITLRMTILRDLEGVAHFMPHGSITSVSNLSYSWSQVALDIPVAYKENVDRVMQVVMEVAQSMLSDEAFGPLIIAQPEMLGVDAFAESAVMIKVLVRTRPLKQWLVKRELLRRLKNRFDDLGIEIPFPHRTVYVRAAAERGDKQEEETETQVSKEQ